MGITLRSAMVYTLLLMLLPLKAHAKIVYIDVNNNLEERLAYVSELKKAGSKETFVAIPEISVGSAKRLTSLGELRDATWVKYVKMGCVQDFAWQPVTGDRCGETQKSLWAIETEIKSIPKTNLTSDSLRSGLQALIVVPGETVTLVISGHFGGGIFTGNLGSISVEEMSHVFNDFPGLASKIVQLHLLGCYTNVFSQVTSLWRTSFANARVLIGFYERSPSGNDPRNLAFIRYLVRHGEALNKVVTEKQFQIAMHSLQPFAGIHAALAIDNMYRETGDELMFVNETSIPLSRCRARLTSGDRDYFASVFSGVAALPNDTDNSRLRHYYSALRDNALCLNETEFTKDQPEIPSPDLAMRLLFFKNVIINFRNLYRNQVSHFDDLLIRLGVAPSLSLENVDLSRRSSILLWSHEIDQQLAGIDPRIDRTEALSLFAGLKRILVDIEPKCVPVNWVEPSAFMPSSCLAQ